MQLNHQLAGKNVLGYYGLKKLALSTHHTAPPREPEEMEQFLTTETLIIELLLIVSIVAVAVRRLRVPVHGCAGSGRIVNHLPIPDQD